jgi:NADH dehydrogenase
MAAASGSRRVVIVGGGFAGLFAARALSGTILWTAGVEAPPLAGIVAKATGAEQDRAGRLLCGKDLSLPGHPDILVTGDLMCLDKLPGVAEVAMQTGLYAGRKITQEAQGLTYDKPFRYHDLGLAAYISRGRAVISAGKLHFGGFIGWVGWLFIHIGFLTGFRNRLGALISWWFAFTRDLRRERTFTIDDLPAVADLYKPSPVPEPRGEPSQDRDRVDRGAGAGSQAERRDHA